MSVYNGDFTNWQSVANNFTDYEVTEEDALLLIPEPEEVLVANYTYECYEGDAWVVYRNRDKFYTVGGSHCSCYGLEGQWNPEEYTPEILLGVLNRMKEAKCSYGATVGYLPFVILKVEQYIKSNPK